MIFSYTDVLKALDDANKLLLSVQSEDEVVMTSNYDYFSIYSKNRITGIKILIVDNANRDEGYRWLEGFITGLMMPRLKDLENNDDTRGSEEKTVVPTKIHLSWIDKLKRWF